MREPEAPIQHFHWSHYLYRVIAAEISAATRYFDRVFQLAPKAHDSGFLLDTVVCKSKERIAKIAELPDLSGEQEQRAAILLNGNFNYDFDIHALLEELKPRLARTSRVMVVAYNPYLRWLYLYYVLIR